MKEINIWWEGPFSYKDIEKNKIKDKHYDNKATDIGLYQIYASHPLYGSDVLVYIGMTISKGGFKSRLKNRWVIEGGNNSEDVKIYLGKIYSNSETINKITEIEKIKNAEALLINALKPAYNASFIQSVGKELLKKDFQVNNANNYRNLYPQLSSKYFWKNLNLNYEILSKIKTEFSVDFIKSEYNENDELVKFKDKINFGVDYDVWQKNLIPLVCYVHKENKELFLGQKTITDIDDEFIYIDVFSEWTKETDDVEEKTKNIKQQLENIISKA